MLAPRAAIPQLLPSPYRILGASPVDQVYPPAPPAAMPQLRPNPYRKLGVVATAQACPPVQYTPAAMTWHSGYCIPGETPSYGLDPSPYIPECPTTLPGANTYVEPTPQERAREYQEDQGMGAREEQYHWR